MRRSPVAIATPRRPSLVETRAKNQREHLVIAAHALVYARNRRLTGRLELTAPDDRRAAVTLWRGRITAVETTPLGLCPGGFFGAVVYELGYIDSQTLDASLLEIAKTKRLHGEVLIERIRVWFSARLAASP